jgi:hypothetical protein
LLFLCATSVILLSSVVKAPGSFLEALARGTNASESGILAFLA